MKRIESKVTYQCEICNKEYSREGHAYACEKIHSHVHEIKYEFYSGDEWEIEEPSMRKYCAICGDILESIKLETVYKYNQEKLKKIYEIMEVKNES